MIRHRPRLTEDGLHCACGSDACVATGQGVWTPSQRPTAEEFRSAVEVLGSAETEQFLREHLSHAGQHPVLAQMQSTDVRTVQWTFHVKQDA